ncbi:hypothetical protein [Streptomyces sp. GESEQ-35]|uniref:hypothetical protein n=1 Tax=Streptomyces sp. GESEQ-35 TaxID=2812657 RepID=UPI001B328B62|nr:hypothetical protein [Streptomyces sp. GESEQ-35]
MEPISIIFLLLAGLAAGAVLAQVTWDMVDTWVRGRSLRGGYAEILSSRLASGDYHVVAGIFTSAGVRAADQTWDAHALDPELTRRLATSGGVIRVRT